MFKVMNAKPAGNKLDKLLDDPRYISEIKLDGYRSICDNGVFYSRLGNDLSAKVPHLTSVLSLYNVVLDGELCMPDAHTNSSDVTKILGSLPEKAVARQEELGKLRYVIFDILKVGDMDVTGLTWEHRRSILDRFSRTNEYCEHIRFTEVDYDCRRALKYAEDNNLEGIMLKNIDSLYYPDKRPEGCWYKVKRSLTYDVVVMGYTEGKGKYKDLIGSIVFGLFDGDTLIECGQAGGMTDEVRRDITEHKDDYVNRVIEISAMEITKDKHFRHPVFKGFRTDKSAEQCVFKEVNDEIQEILCNVKVYNL